MQDENIETLKSLIDAPFIGKVPQVDGQPHGGQYLDLAALNL
jgi:hypothetical protein